MPTETAGPTVSSDDPLLLFCPLVSAPTWPGVLLPSGACTAGLVLMPGWGASGCSGLDGGLELPQRRFCRRAGLPRRFLVGGSMGDEGGGWDVPFMRRGWMGTWGVGVRLMVGPEGMFGKLGAFAGSAGFGRGDGAGEVTGSGRGGGSRLRLWCGAEE